MFEPEKLHFNYIDILGIPRRALKIKKIWGHLVGLILGYPIYVVLTYLALVLDGHSLSSMWNRFGIYPWFFPGDGAMVSLPSWGVYLLGILIFIVINLLAGTVVSRIIYKELKGDPFYSIDEGLAFLRRHGGAVIAAPLSLVLILAFLVVMALLFALIGKLPFLGEIFFVGLYPFIFAGALFTLLSGVVLIVLLLYLPPILATWEEDAIGSVFQAYAITWNQPWRIVVYSLLIGVLACAGFFAYGWAITVGYHFINWVFGQPWLMGAKLAPILGWAEQFVFSGYSSLFSFIPGQGANLSTMTDGFQAAAITGWQAFLGSLLALVLMLIYGSVWAYGLAILSVGQCLAFLIYKFKTDDENLLIRKDEEDLAAEPAPAAQEADAPTSPDTDTDG